MPRQKSDQPAYRYHVSGQAVVSFCGQNFYLGEYDSPESRAKYFALLSEYLANGKTKAPGSETHQKDQPITVRCVTAEYRQLADSKYVNSESHRLNYLNLCGLLEDEYGDLPAVEFGPRKLADLRDLFVASGNCRKYVNSQVRCIIRMFRHAVSRELIDVAVITCPLQSLQETACH